MPLPYVEVGLVRYFLGFSLALVSWIAPLQAAEPIMLIKPPVAIEQDYIVPSPDMDLVPQITPYQMSEAEQAAFACTIYCGTTVEYTAWNGTRYLMQEFLGRKMRVLIPQSWFEVASFSADSRRRFVDAIDLNYQYAMEVSGSEPSGSGLNTIAFVYPTGCGTGAAGCGNEGSKGIEMNNYDPPRNNAHYWEATDKDSLYDLISHELGHNFDTNKFSRNANMGVNTDSAHFYVYMLGHATTYDYSYDPGDSPALSSREFADQQESRTLYTYRGISGANWQACGANETCGVGANRVLAGPLYRARQLYGRGVYKRFLSFYKTRLASGQPATTQDKMDLMFEAYSAAANRNMLCLLDTLQWPISPAARARVNTAYPQANPHCTTLGSNGQPLILGDPLYSGISNPTLYNNADDEEHFSVRVPAQITGRTIAGRASMFRVSNARNSRFRVFHCSTAGTGTTADVWYWPMNESGSAYDGYPFATPVRGACALGFFHQRPVNSGPFWLGSRSDFVTASNAGSYTVSIAVEPYTPKRWADLNVSRNPTTGVLTFSVANVDTSLVDTGAQTVRYWVQGRGWVANANWSGNRVATWQPASNEDVSGLVMRAQVYGAEGPVSSRTKSVVYGADDIFGNGYN